MEATIILAEAIVVHPDGTFSMLRGGLTRAWGALPVVLKGALLVRFEADPADAASHNWGLCVIDQDASDIMPRLQGSFAVPPRGGQGTIVMSFVCKFPQYGPYSFRLSIDKQLEKRWNIDVAETATSTPQEE